MVVFVHDYFFYFYKRPKKFHTISYFRIYVGFACWLCGQTDIIYSIISLISQAKLHYIQWHIRRNFILIYFLTDKTKLFDQSLKSGFHGFLLFPILRQICTVLRHIFTFTLRFPGIIEHIMEYHESIM